jgi:hypothetical protein
MKNKLLERCPALARRDHWAVARLLLVALLFGLWGRWRFQWSAASLPAVEHTLGGMLGVFCFCGLLSVTLARFYLAFVTFPLYATTVLNDWLYGACYWTFRTLLRLLYMRRVSALVALLSELGLFLCLWQTIARLLQL